MPSLPILILYGALAAASLVQRSLKRAPADTVQFGTVTYTDGSCLSWFEGQNDSGDVLTIAFNDLSIVPTTEPLVELHCSLEVEVIYPPGCTKASLARQIAGSTTYSDAEDAQGTIINRYVLSTGQWHDFALGYALHYGRDGPWVRDYNMDASVAVREDAEQVVILEVEVDMRLEKFVDPSTGMMTFQRLTLDISNQTTDADWENCRIEIPSTDDHAGFGLSM